MKKRISQSQIAKELGVSQSLVSLVLNGRRENVSDESYHRIWSLAMQQDYAPRGMQSIYAPDLRRSYVGIVLRSGLEVVAQSNTFRHVQQGLFKVFQKAHISTALLGGEGDLDENGLFELMERRDPLQGIVIYGEVSESFLQAMGVLNVELLSVYASAPGICHSVVPNEKQSVEQLVDHLVKLGHTQFAWLGGNSRLESNHLRVAALKECLAARKLTIDERNIIDLENGDRQEGFDCAQELCRRNEGRPLPTAWVCYNALMARGALQYALLRGINVPQEISLAAIDQTQVCTEIHPFLTCAASDPQLIGEEAAKLICKADHSADRGQRMFFDLVVPSSFDAGETSAACAG